MSALANTLRKKFYVYIDFDLTLFDNVRFKKDLFTAIRAQAKMPLPNLEQDMRAHQHDAILGGYDYASHMLSYGLHAESMWQLLEAVAQSDSYLYDDATPFIQNLYSDGYMPRILSFGEKRFQETKIVPTLFTLAKQGLEFDVVFRKKGEHLADMHAGERGVLVDDVAAQDLPEGFTEIQINRSLMHASPQQKPDGYLVSNLSQARQVILTLT